MPRLRSHIALAAALLLLPASVSARSVALQNRPASISAQKNKAPKAAHPRRKPLGNYLADLRALPPEQREQALKSEPAFQRLTPERQQRILNRLRWFNSLTPQQQDKIIARMHRLSQLTPEQHRQLHQIYTEWRALPADKRREFKRAYAELLPLSPSERDSKMSDASFKTRFSDHERDLLLRVLALPPGVLAPS